MYIFIDCHRSFSEIYVQFTQAKNAHKLFLQRHNETGSEYENDRILAFKLAERNYIASSERMSQRLANSFINFDLDAIVIGILCLVTVSNHSIAFFVKFRFLKKLLIIQQTLYFRHFFT